MPRIVLIGAGSLGREVQAWLRTSGHTSRIVFVDDIKPTSRAVPVIGKLEEIGMVLFNEDQILVAQARPRDRESITKRVEGNWPPIVFTHATAMLAPGVEVQPGSMLLPYSLVSTGAQLGKSLLLNTGAHIGHDARIGDYVTVCSKVVLTGGVEVGDRVFFGTGAIVHPGVRIAHDAYVGSGAVVVRDVGPGERVFGNPARTIKAPTEAVE